MGITSFNVALLGPCEMRVAANDGGEGKAMPQKPRGSWNASGTGRREAMCCRPLGEVLIACRR
jgi:hypothetical protein